jgi:hypothetical protein
MPEPRKSQPDLDPGDALELPPRHVLSLISPTITDGLLSYANAAQNSPPTSQGVTGSNATSNPLFSQGLSTVNNAAQSAPSTPNGATVQNLNSPNSSGVATTSHG